MRCVVSNHHIQICLSIQLSENHHNLHGQGESNQNLGTHQPLRWGHSIIELYPYLHRYQDSNPDLRGWNPLCQPLTLYLYLSFPTQHPIPRLSPNKSMNVRAYISWTTLTSHKPRKSNSVLRFWRAFGYHSLTCVYATP